MKEKLLQELDYRDRDLTRSQSVMSLAESKTKGKSESLVLRRVSLGQPSLSTTRRRSTLEKTSQDITSPVQLPSIVSSVSNKEERESISRCLHSSSKALLDYEGRGQVSNTKASHKVK